MTANPGKIRILLVLHSLIPLQKESPQYETEGFFIALNIHSLKPAER
jgi:hypothetical protein